MHNSFVLTCPVCNNEKLHKVLDDSLSRHIFRCQSCGMMFRANSQSDYYKEYYQYAERKVIKSYAKKNARRQLKFIEAFISLDTVHSILEIGCGRGYLAKLLLRVASVDRMILIEPNFTDYNLLPSSPKIESHNCTFQESYINGTFDLIILSHVLEHLESPIDILKELYLHLRPGGAMFIEVPASSFEFRSIESIIKLH